MFKTRLCAIVGALALATPASVNTKDHKDTVAQTPLVEPKLECSDCTPKEQQVITFFHEEGITDKAAMAVVLANIKQESKFQSSVCEGGLLTSYRGCRSGGYGLIQWTSAGRFHGLGRYAEQTQQKPEHMTTQLGYLVTEPQWRSVVNVFKTPGLSFGSYMQAAYKWLGWGVKGPRSRYALDYYNRLVLV